MVDTPAPGIQTTEDAVHQSFMRKALERARLSPPATTKYCVGAALVDAKKGLVLSTGYSLEPVEDQPNDPGSVHAEHACLLKLAKGRGLAEVVAAEPDRVREALRPEDGEDIVLYTTMEPCSRRLSGNRTCTDRILALEGRLRAVYVGIPEPKTFIEDCRGMRMLSEAGIEVVLVKGMDEEIRKVATNHGGSVEEGGSVSAGNEGQ